MTTYDYCCPDCGHIQEEVHSIKLSAEEANIECKKCQRRPMIRKVSGGSGFILKGDGWPSKTFRVKSQMERSQRKAEKRQAVEWGHMKESQVLPNCDGEVTGKAGDPEAWRKAGKLAGEKGFDSTEYENKARECERAKKIPDHLKTSQIIASKGDDKATSTQPAESVVREIPRTHTVPSNE